MDKRFHMTPISNLYDQAAELFSQIEANKLMAFRPSKAMQERFNELVEKSHKCKITDKEKDELDHFVVLERLISLAMARVWKPR